MSLPRSVLKTAFLFALASAIVFSCSLSSFSDDEDDDEDEVTGGYGASWTERPIAGAMGWSGWKAVASSADGTRLAAVNGGYVYTSTDGGATWTERTAAGSRQWETVALSADGTKLCAGGLMLNLFTSP